MNVTIQNIDKCKGHTITDDWYITEARVIGGYYIWNAKNMVTDESRRIVLNRKVEANSRLKFVHFGEHHAVQSDISKARLTNMKSTLKILGDELKWAETTYNP